MIHPSFSDSLPTDGAIVVPVLKDGLDSGPIAALDSRCGGALGKAAKLARFSGKAGETLTVPGPSGLDGAVVTLLGLGSGEGEGAPRPADVGGKALAAAGKFPSVAIAVEGLSFGALEGAALMAEIAFGAMMRSYRFDLYRTKTKDDDETLSAITVVGPEADAAKEAFADHAAIAEGVKFARDLVTEPPNVLYPESYADRCKELEQLGVKVTILDKAKMTELGMGSLLGVGQGSVRESRLVVMEWNGGEANQKPIAFVGKGVTFDTGGISLKPPAGMEDMKFDMGGSAAVVGAMKAVAGRKAKANVVGLVGLVENMPDGNAQRPSDVVKSMSGQTIEVLNTDAEGRLVLADVLTYAQKTYGPEAIVDLATLTGAIIVALAHEFGGCFAHDDGFAGEVIAAGTAVGEPLWRMPVNKAFDEMLKSDIADMKNIGGREGGSSTAAAFLGRFVEKGTPWAHLDIAGMAWAKKNEDVCPKGATGFGVRLLDALVRSRYER